MPFIKVQSQRSGVSMSSACRIVADISAAIARLYSKYIFLHTRTTEKAQCEDGIFGNRWLLGDSAYPNQSYLLTPLLNPTTSQEIRYNEAHIKTRNIIERAFGVWKCCFPVISLTMRLSLPNIQNVIIATSILHNICRSHNIEEISPVLEVPAEN